MITFPFTDVINAIRNAKKGVEVRENLAQMGEYCKKFTEEAGQKANAARDEAKGYAADAKASEKKATDAVAGIEQTKTDAVQAVQQAQSTATTAVTTKQTEAVQAVDDERDAALQQVANSTKAAQTAASNAGSAASAARDAATAAGGYAGNAKSSATAASGSASAAATSESNANQSAENSEASAARSEAAAKRAEAVVGTDKTLKTENAPADAKAVGDIILDRTKETPQPIFYSKAEVDKLLAQHTKDTLLAAYPVGRLYMSAEATSPASLFGGTWEQIKDKFILAAGDTYAAGTSGGEAEHTLTVPESPTHTHQQNAYVINAGFTENPTIPGRGLSYPIGNVNVYYSAETVSGAGNFDGISTSPMGMGHPHNNMPPYVTVYVWKRIA